MARKFDLGSVAASVSNLDTSAAAAAPAIQLIPLEDIETNDKNLYGIRDLDALMDSIAMEGLQQPLVVTPGEGGKYLLISGHRRRAAIAALVQAPEHPRPDLRLVPCLVRTYSSPEMAELQLIMANSTTRVLSASEQAIQAERVEDLLYQLKKQGYSFPGRMRDQVAQACQVSASKLARLKVIRHGLSLTWQKQFALDALSEQAAYALARMPEDFQERLARCLSEKLCGGDAEWLLQKHESGERWSSDLICPDGKPCTHADAFLRHDLNGPGYQRCYGHTCCLDCPHATTSFGSCANMCARAKAVRKDQHDKESAEASRRTERQSQKYKRETQAAAQRLLPVLQAAGLSPKNKIDWNYCDAPTVRDVQNWAQGVFAPEVWHYAKLTRPPAEPAKLAQQLRCSTDFLFGLTDDPTPADQRAAAPAPDVPSWRRGQPPESGRYLCHPSIDGINDWVGLLYYDAASRVWKFSRKDKEPYCLSSDMEGWYPIPRESEEDKDEQKDR